MTAELNIRPIRGQDRDRWQPLWRAYLAFYNTDVGAEVYEATFARYADPDFIDMRGWMAWDGDTALGLAHSIAHLHGWKSEPTTYLQDLFTTPGARGKGVARALIDAVYADADAAGRPSVYWLTQTGNTTARALYDKIALPTDFMIYRRKLD
jgi:GNAT superfamily N-acetyltransferase